MQLTGYADATGSRGTELTPFPVLVLDETDTREVPADTTA